EAGLFVSSTPAPGQSVDISVEDNKTITVTLSAGPDSIAIPDVSGMTQDQARQELVDAGFNAANISTSTEDLPGRPRDEADRTEPESGTDAAPDSAITIIMGSGNVELPDLRTMTVEQLEETMRELQLQYDTGPAVNSNDYDEGTVAAQNPNPGLVRIDTRVTVQFSLGPTEEPTTDEPTTDDPTDDPTTDDPPDNGGGGGGGGDEPPGGEEG
ncbi:PASTA domain-containing protein, partial [Pseudactinotalea sp.]|uniref:PASTA domain-containing protein n=1 Tax=Pseudactinotalea sp. TaxID=1926260 RepID=UPI003B3B6B5E